MGAYAKHPLATELLLLKTEFGRRIDALIASLGVTPPEPSYARSPASRGRPEKAVKHDLEGPYDDPEVRATEVKGWSGPSMAGRPYSDCPSEFLLKLADRLEWIANKCEASGELAKNGKPRAEYVRLDAARARGWAEKNTASGQHRTRSASDFLAGPDEHGTDDVF